MTEPISILVLVPKLPSTISEIRLLRPLDRVTQKFPAIVLYREYEALSKADFKGVHIVVIQRQATQFILKLVKLLKEKEIPVVFEIDDLLINIPPFLQSARENNRNAQATVKLLRQSSAVTTTTGRLKSALTPYSTNIHVIPNCADFPAISPAPIRNYAEIDFVFASTDTGAVDVLLSSLKTFFARHPKQKIRLHVFGPHAKSFNDPSWVTLAYEIMPYNSFIDVLKHLKNPIALVPLDDSWFSSCKSPVKFIDYTSALIPVIASNCPPYSDVILSGKTGILVDNNVGSWCDAMDMLLNRPELRKKIAQNAYQYCSEHYQLDHASEQWYLLFGSLNPHRREMGLFKLPRGLTINTLRISPKKLSKGLHVYREKGINGLLASVRRLW